MRIYIYLERADRPEDGLFKSVYDIKKKGE
jgi:hypothetical protein